jgi:hypothetical protein
VETANRVIGALAGATDTTSPLPTPTIPPGNAPVIRISLTANGGGSPTTG